MNRHEGWAWPELNQVPSTRYGRIAGTVLPAMFLAYLSEPVRQVFGGPYSPLVQVIVVVVVVLYAATFLFALLSERRSSHVVRVLCVAVMLACGVTFAVVLGPDDLVYMTYVTSVALVQLPPFVGLFLGFSVTVALLVGTTIADGTPDLGSASVLIVLTVALFGIRQVIRSNAELRAARDEIATLAVAEERVRLARDLHDVLGHSLTTITVKAGLARRILESSGELGPAVAELRDVEHLSRTALAEVRTTVSGYRRASLPGELVGARAALAAAEIQADLPHAVDNVPAVLQEPFAYVLREGVTNVIRHSGARRCEVRLGESWIEIRDDGAGSGGGAAGHGLAGLAERLAEVGGTVIAGSLPEGGFRLLATVLGDVGMGAEGSGGAVDSVRSVGSDSVGSEGSVGSVRMAGAVGMGSARVEGPAGPGRVIGSVRSEGPVGSVRMAGSVGLGTVRVEGPVGSVGVVVSVGLDSVGSEGPVGSVRVAGSVGSGSVQSVEADSVGVECEGRLGPGAQAMGSSPGAVGSAGGTATGRP